MPIENVYKSRKLVIDPVSLGARIETPAVNLLAGSSDSLGVSEFETDYVCH